MPNPQGKLRISMTAQATIVLDKAKDVLLIPSAALGAKGKDGRYAVRVVSEAAAAIRARLGDTVANELAALVDKKLAEINDSARRKQGRDDAA